jgi:hypothetical protein
MNIATSSTSAPGPLAEHDNAKQRPCRIVLCFDSTGKQFNVVAVGSLLPISPIKI